MDSSNLHTRRALEHSLGRRHQADRHPPPQEAAPGRAGCAGTRQQRAEAISREQAAVYLGVGYSTLEKLAARGEGPFSFKVGNLVR
jgi:excisionase family DNA binding protein